MLGLSGFGLSRCKQMTVIWHSQLSVGATEPQG
jgi:hypothetical protein